MCSRFRNAAGHVNSVLTIHPQTTRESNTTLPGEEPSPVFVERDPKRSPAVGDVLPLGLCKFSPLYDGSALKSLANRSAATASVSTTSMNGADGGCATETFSTEQARMKRTTNLFTMIHHARKAPPNVGYQRNIWFEVRVTQTQSF